jgi:glycosyltransferase involved in cell wall biosynthesis
VVAHGHEGMLVALAARGIERAGRVRRRPIVYAPHTAFGEELPTYLPSRYERMAGPIARMGSTLDRTLPRRADACLSISRRMDALLAEAGAGKVVPTRPGIDPDEFAETLPERPSPPDARWVAYCGNPDAYQDLPVLARAMDLLRGRLGPGAPRLVVIGDWPEAEVRALAPDAVVRPRDWGHARDVLAGCDAAVIPRTRCAGFPMKLLNHVALGVPTVIAAGSAQGLPGEIVVPDSDANALAEGIVQACVAPRVQAGAREGLTWDRTIQPLRELLGELVST